MYVPTEIDKQFVGNLIASLRDGGRWGIPMTGEVFQIDHRNKTLIRVFRPPVGASPALDQVIETNWEKHIEVFGAFGYAVREAVGGSLTAVQQPPAPGPEAHPQR